MLFRKYAAWLLLATVLAVGCGGPGVTVRAPVGRIVDAEVVPRSFNECKKMLVRCEGAVVVIKDALPPVPIGEPAELVTLSDGSEWITWESTKQRWRVD